MKTSRYSVSRQKACQSCAQAKVKCLLGSEAGTGACRRCQHRGIACSYVSVELAHHYPSPPDMENAAVPAQEQRQIHDLVRPTQLVPEQHSGSNVDFNDIVLVCLINADEISNRWLNSYMPTDQQKPKSYPASVTNFISRMLNAYIGMVARGKGVPAFIHRLQIETSAPPEPLATCLSIIRMCETVLPATQTACIDIIQHEMGKIYEWRGTFDNATMLGAFQAYLLYSLALFYRLNQKSNALLQQAMMTLQELACMSSRQGLVCSEEQHQARPRWASWILAEAKRRTLYTMYLFDSVLLVEDGLPTFMATEVHGLLAPGPKALWSAQTSEWWEVQYNQYLADWPDTSLTIDELWPIPSELDSDAVARRHARVDRWLESVDEYGTMMYAVTSCTHGG
jgi:hypothetical protein